MHYLSAFLFFSVFIALLGEWSQLGSHIHQVISEVPLLMLLYAFFYGVQKPGRYRIAIALLPIVITYVAFDYFYIEFARTFRFADLSNFDELIYVLSPNQLLILVVGIASPVILLVKLFDSSKIKLLFKGAAFFVLITLVIVFQPSWFIKYLQSLSPGIWYQHVIVLNNGRFMSTLFFEAERRSILNSINNYSSEENDKKIVVVEDSVVNKPDIHIIVMESLVYAKFLDVYQSEINKLVPGNFLNGYAPFISSSQSPVFGGNTPRAEFEILCGVPSVSLYGNNEFNLVNYGGLSCLPNILKKTGYYTIASNPYKPSYFNEERAYKALGFDEAHFLDKYAKNSSSYLTMTEPEKGFVFDGDMFDANITYLEKVKKESSRPILNYLMTTYGHTPHYLADNQKKIIDKKPGIDSLLNSAVNQSYYSFEALAEYLDQLKNISPNSMIIVIGDHLPPVSAGTKSFVKAGYLSEASKGFLKTPALLLENGRAIKINKNMFHYWWAEIILDRVSGGNYCQRNNCYQEKSAYLPLYHSMMVKTLKGDVDQTQ